MIIFWCNYFLIMFIYMVVSVWIYKSPKAAMIFEVKDMTNLICFILIGCIPILNALCLVFILIMKASDILPAPDHLKK